MDIISKQGLFGLCSFAIVRSHEFLDEDASKLSDLIKLHGGTVVVDDYGEENLRLDDISHIISTTSDFPDYNAACDALIPVVKPLWIEHSLAKNKLAHTRSYSPDPRLILSDVVACCADLPEGDTDAIAGGILAMGGMYASRLTSQVTHIVTLTMDSEPCIIAKSKGLNVKIVLPHWFDDCLKLGKKINEQPYLLPDPDILRPPQIVAPIGAPNKHVTGALRPDPADIPKSSQHDRKVPLKVFNKKTVMLARDLRIGSHLRKILEELITSSGGQITESVHEADIYVCKYREGQDYQRASRAGKDVGNLSWLCYMITNDTWTSPLKRLLHYPIAPEGLPGFKGFKISLSNYSGEARTYLENLVIATGAECTKTLKQDNTHLISAHIISEKCAAAKDWGIHLVNHLWLEESYARWKLQSITDPRYTHFPSRTNLGEVVGQTSIDRNILELHFFPEDVEMTDAPPNDQSDQSDVPAVKQEAVTPGPSKALKAKAAKQSNKSPTVNGATRFQTPVNGKHASMGKENVTPSTTGSRKSKDAAAAKLQNMTSDIALYEKERKRVGGVIYGGRRVADEDRVAINDRKRSVEAASDDSDDEVENDVKRLKKGPSNPTMHLLISGYPKWIGQAKVEDQDKKQLRNLGIIITVNPARATHLAAPKVVRTHKFVVAMAYAPLIISTKFIDDCLNKDELLDPNSYILVDKAAEKKLGVSLKISRERAKENQNDLFKGRSIYCIENISGGFSTYESIVHANGGQCMSWRARKGTMVPSTRADSEDEDNDNEVYLLSGADNDHAKLWQRFREMAVGSRKVPRIVNTDWLIETAMTQKIQPVKEYELS